MIGPFHYFLLFFDLLATLIRRLPSHEIQACSRILHPSETETLWRVARSFLHLIKQRQECPTLLVQGAAIGMHTPGRLDDNPSGSVNERIPLKSSVEVETSVLTVSRPASTARQ
jgi:hypothetical protein